MGDTQLAGIHKLKCADDYSNWSFAMEHYLKDQDLWGCVVGTSNTYIENELKMNRAMSRIVNSVDPHVFSYIKKCKTSKDMWRVLRETFEGGGLNRKVSLLRTLVSVKLDDFCSTDEYVNKIFTTAEKLESLDFEVGSEWIGALLLAGLPEKYEPMIMGLESCGKTLTAEVVKAKILQEVIKGSNNPNEESVYLSKHYQKSNNKNYKKKFNKGPRCYKCNKYGHIAKNCRSKQEHSHLAQENEEQAIAWIISDKKINKNSNWYVDSGATQHMTSNKNLLQNYKLIEPKMVKTANGRMMKAIGQGTACISIHTHNSAKDIVLNNTLHVPELDPNLISVQKLTALGFSVNFNESSCDIINKNSQKIIASAYKSGNMYIFSTVKQENANLARSQEKCSPEMIALWHRRLAHLNRHDMVKLNSLATGYNVNGVNNEPCESCLKGKQSRLPFPKESERANTLLELVHSDICGPMEVPSVSGARYMLTFTDDYSRFTQVYFLKAKSEFFVHLQNFVTLVENQLNFKIKAIRSDNAMEYKDKKVQQYLMEKGIRWQSSCPYTPQQNGVAERKNRTIVEKARTILSEASAPKKLWAEASYTANYLINRSPSKALLNTTPFEMWSGKRPDLSHLKVFGCIAMVHIPKEQRKKWDEKSKTKVFVGYAETQKGYRLFDSSSNKITISRDVIFIENKMFFEKDMKENLITENRQIQEVFLPISEDSEENEIISNQEEQTESSEKDNIQETPKIRQTRTRKQPARLDDFILTLKKKEKEHKNIVEPNTWQEALKSEFKDEWYSSMKKEMECFEENQAFTLTDLPQEKTPIELRWVFQIKRDENDKIIKFRSRLVAKGFMQKPNVDYFQTFAPVVRYTTIRFLVTLSLKYNLTIYHLDVETAFLKSLLKEEIYAKQPEPFIVKNQESKVLKLNKAIYGLKQGSMAWHETFTSILFTIGLKQSAVDPCVYQYKNEKTKDWIIVAIYVDDQMVLTSSEKLKEDLVQKLSEKLKIKELGLLRYFLNIKFEVQREQKYFKMTQENYIANIVENFRLQDCNIKKTPLDASVKLEKIEDSPTVTSFPYAEGVGSCLYLSQTSRPDICYAATYLSSFNNDPRRVHIEALKHLIKYLKGTKTLALTLKNDQSDQIVGYSDADWANDIRDRKSVTGYIFFYNGSPISWSSKKQKTPATSTCQAEYQALSAACAEAQWLKQLITEFDPEVGTKPIIMKMDNNSAINLAMTSSYKANAKHIDVKHHYVRDLIKKEIIKIEHTSSEDMIADYLTKTLNSTKHHKCVTNTGLFEL